MWDAILLNALGEIGIIVIGVLIALAVDRWKESRKDRQMGKHYLLGLQRDLEQDCQQLQDYCEEIGQALRAAENVLSIINGETQPKQETFGADLIRAANGNEPTYTLATYTELANGNLHLIKNGSLKNSIVRYYSSILTGERARSPYTPQLWYETGVEPYLLELWKILPAEDWLAWFKGSPSYFDTKEILNSLKAVSEIPQYLEACRRCRRLQLTKFQFHRQEAKDLLNMVEKEQFS